MWEALKNLADQSRGLAPAAWPRGKSSAVAEHEARGETERVYHEIKQVLRVSGVNLNFRTWARFGSFLPRMWDAMRANAETRAFEDAADQIRREAVDAAAELGKLNANTHLYLGESQAYRLQAALELYHYINPKLLILTSAVRLALEGHLPGFADSSSGAVERIERGIPARMHPMEMVSDPPRDAPTREIFDDIKKTLSLPAVNSDYRTLALWPNYFSLAWQQLKPIVVLSSYEHAADQLRETARSLARQLPLPISLDREQLKAEVEGFAEVVTTTDRFEQLLPGLILNIALFQFDWRSAEQLRHSPFPADTRRSPQGETA